jgi:hypothetical protein
MNRGRRKARVGDEALGQLVINQFLQILVVGLTTRSSSDEEDLLWLMGGTNRNLKEERNVLGDLTRG